MAERSIPELANFITLLNERWGGTNPLVAGLYRWETLVYAGIVIAGLIGLFSVGLRRRKIIPEKLQNVLEFVVANINDFVAGTLGAYSARFVPFLGTLFLYILFMNLMVLVPGMKSPTSDLNTTAALAIVVFVYVQYVALRELGLKGTLQHLCGGLLRKPANPMDYVVLLIVPLIFGIELVGQVFRPVSLSLRLFGNVTSEDVMVGVLNGFGVQAGTWLGLPFGPPLEFLFYFFVLVFSFVQAAIFTILSMVYISLALPHAAET